MAAEDPAATFRTVAQRLSALPGGLDYTGTPEGMATLITEWWEAGASDGLTIMPNVLPGQLDAIVDERQVLHPAGAGHPPDRYAGTTCATTSACPGPQLTAKRGS